MRGSPDVSDTHPLPAPLFCMWFGTLRSVGCWNLLQQEEIFLPWFPLPPTPTPGASPGSEPVAPQLEGSTYRML